MPINKNEVLLLKSQADDGNDKYETLLKQNDFTVKHVQVLEFQFINLSDLKEKLNNPDLYSGIVFTSPRAVHATAKCLENSQLDGKWSDKNNFVVGETTYELVKKELGLICKGKESGNSNNLAEIIVNEPYKLPFLFPSGNLKKEILGQRLNDCNIKLDAITVYETIKYNNLETDFYRLTNNLETLPEYILYFSPSGVKFTSAILRKCLDCSNEIKLVAFLQLVAIGPSTAEALQNEEFTVFSVASKPTELDLLNAIVKR